MVEPARQREKRSGTVVRGRYTDASNDRDDGMIQAKELRKDYRMGETVVHALDGVDLSIGEGEFVSITGASGSGKSTLMHILGCLDRPTSGTLEFRGARISDLSEKQLAEVRNRHIGFVFQTFNLINRTTALDNVIVPLMYTRRSIDKSAARRSLERVGLMGRSRHTPSELSGGECQRVAIARAIVNNPSLILADEPTGNLDTRTSEQIMGVFHQLRADGITIVLVTHEKEIAVQADRMIHMKDGRIVEDVAVDDARRRRILALTRDHLDESIRRGETNGITTTEAGEEKKGGSINRSDRPLDDRLCV